MSVFSKQVEFGIESLEDRRMLTTFAGTALEDLPAVPADVPQITSIEALSSAKESTVDGGNSAQSATDQNGETGGSDQTGGSEEEVAKGSSDDT